MLSVRAGSLGHSNSAHALGPLPVEIVDDEGMGVADATRTGEMGMIAGQIVMSVGEIAGLRTRKIWSVERRFKTRPYPSAFVSACPDPFADRVSELPVLEVWACA